ncbi:MAG: hypothetical protein ABFD50_04635 [Smithella sp.]
MDKYNWIVNMIQDYNDAHKQIDDMLLDRMQDYANRLVSANTDTLETANIANNAIDVLKEYNRRKFQIYKNVFEKYEKNIVLHFPNTYESVMLAEISYDECIDHVMMQTDGEEMDSSIYM